jgi:hypothetical protein
MSGFSSGDKGWDDEEALDELVDPVEPPRRALRQGP